ncbi:MAG TPA: hypothetical protein VIT85_02190 [Solirubrobacterales bacterium]
MSAVRALAAVLALGAVLAVPAGALELEIDRASDRSVEFAQRTCDRDRYCVRQGVLNCRRHSPRVALCRIFNERRTPVQGSYRCDRLIRLSLDPRSRRVPVTGLGRWHC